MFRARNRCPFIDIERRFVFYRSALILHPFSVARFKQTVPIDDYVIDVLMRDLVGHDQHPAAYLVYVYLYGLAARNNWKPLLISLRGLADATGLSKSAVHVALQRLRRRELITTDRQRATATPRHRVLRHWRRGVR